jgi:hypothetical protein
MRRVSAIVLAFVVAFGVAGCAPAGTDTAAPTSSSGVPTIDPALIPQKAPESVINVAPAAFKVSSGDFVFKVGSGPTWCTISPDFQLAICEQNEVSTQYAPIPVPDTCDFSYGYQVELKSTAPADGSPEAFFPCLGSTFTDPTGALTLQDGQQITAAGFTCFVAGDTARCENKEKHFIVLGPKAWALG